MIYMYSIFWEEISVKFVWRMLLVIKVNSEYPKLRLIE